MNLGDKVEINKNGTWLNKGRITKLTTKGAYVHGLVSVADEVVTTFHEWIPFTSLRLRLVRCADQT